MSWTLFCIYLFIIGFTDNFVRSHRDTNWSYKWICGKESKCLRKHADEITITELSYKTQNACRLVCGRYGSLWPRPTNSILLGQALLAFDPAKIRFDLYHVPNTTLAYVNEISRIFMSNIQRECINNCTSTANTDILIQFFVNSNETEITWQTDESYSIEVITRGSQATVEIQGQTAFGVRHGLETLSQLITTDLSDTDPHSSSLLLVASVELKDYPKFPHRGLLLDTARNFLPLEDIERTIDGMAASKLNVLHWHATDAQSFPLEMPTVPQLTRYGAYSPKHIYSPNDVKHIIEYAKHRGVRVIIEIDAPSHAGNGWNWGPKYGLGDLAVCVNKQPWRYYCIQPPCGQLNPANPQLFDILRDVYHDLVEVLPHRETIHMGGDEVHFGCWNSTQEIIDLLERRGHGREHNDFLQLWAEYQTAALRVWDEECHQNPSSRRESHEAPNKIILWSSHLTNPEHIERYLQKERYIIQTWVESYDDLPLQLLEKGYQVIISTKDAWYFDHGFWGQTPYYHWHKVYENRVPQHSGVLGGEACVWSELIDKRNLDSRTWPRAAAVAERLWADPETDARLATTRFYRHNDRLRTRGIKSEPIAPKYCIQNEGECY